MAIITETIFTDLLVILSVIIIGLITYFKWSFKYWERKNLPSLETSFPFGSMRNPIWNLEGLPQQFLRQYNESKAKGYKHVGLNIFSVPMYMPLDPEYIRNVLTKDFDHFKDRGVYYNEKEDPMSAHLFALEGAQWRNLRAKLTPTFTSGKMKMMFPILNDCADQLKNFMGKVGSQPVNIKDVLGLFTADVIGSCAFGIECNSFQNPDSEFRRNLKDIFTASKFEIARAFFAFTFTNLSRFLGVRFMPNRPTDFIMGVVKKIVGFREKNKVVRNDFMQLLLELKNEVVKCEGEFQHDGKNLTLNELAAQAFVFLLAGYETSSTTMTFFLFELALNSEIQKKVRDEINSVLENHGGSITYEAITEMKYMEQVIDETLRKYPPLPILNRKCVADYKVPGTDLTVEKGTLVVIPIIGLQHDEEHFPNPEKFDPDRFSKNNRSKINPFTYMPFGEGPRTCIALRFGMMQTKVGLAVLLKNYVFSLNEKTKMPLKYERNNFILSALEGIWLNIDAVN